MRSLLNKCPFQGNTSSFLFFSICCFHNTCSLDIDIYCLFIISSLLCILVKLAYETVSKMYRLSTLATGITFNRKAQEKQCSHNTKRNTQLFRLFVSIFYYRSTLYETGYTYNISDFACTGLWVVVLFLQQFYVPLLDSLSLYSSWRTSDRLTVVR